MQIPVDDESKKKEDEAFPELNDEACADEKYVGIKSRGKKKIIKKEFPKKKRDEINKLNEIITNLTSELEEREKELAEAQDKSARAVAEADNFKKRIAKESDDSKRYAAVSTIEKLLPAIDNLDMAVVSAKGDAGTLDQLRDGVELVAKQIKDALAEQGLEEIDVVGKVFDPATSEAVQMMETDEHEDGIVINCFLSGYKFKDRTIRTAKVVVAKNNG